MSGTNPESTEIEIMVSDTVGFDINGLPLLLGIREAERQHLPDMVSDGLNVLQIVLHQLRLPGRNHGKGHGSR